MKLIANQFVQQVKISVFLKSPIVKTDKKLVILIRYFLTNKLGITSMMFVNIITTKKRENVFRRNCKSFITFNINLIRKLKQQQ